MARPLLLIVLLLLIMAPVVLAVTVTVDNKVSQAKITITYTDPVRLTGLQLTHPNNKGDPPTYALSPAQGTTTANLQTRFEYTTAQGVSLAPGGYVLLLDAYDAKGQSIADNSVPFSIEGIEMARVSPLCGVSTTQTGPLTFKTYKNVSGTVQDVRTYCLVNGRAPAIGPASTHTTTLAFSGKVTVECSEGINNGALIGQKSNATWTLGVDASAPNVTNTTTTPPVVTSTSQPVAQLDFTTDDLSACAVRLKGGAWRTIENRTDCASYAKEHTIELRDFKTSEMNRTDYQYEINCTNLAQQSRLHVINVTANFGDSLELVKISPADYLNGQTSFPVDLVIKPMLADPALVPVGACYVNVPADATCESLESETARRLEETTDPRSPAPPLEHSVAFKATFQKGSSGFAEGNNTLRVSCCIQKDLKTLNKTVNYTLYLDSIDPSAPSITTANAVCGGKLRAAFGATDRGSGIALYEYKATYDGKELGSGNATPGQLPVIVTAPSPAATEPRYDPAKSVTWEVTAYDGAGNKASNTTSGPLHEGSEEECTNVPFITLLSPAPLGFAQSQPYDFIIRTKRASVYRFGKQGTDETAFSRFPSTGGTQHELRGLLAPDVMMSVACAESGRVHRATFHIGYSTGPPLIDVQATPAVVKDRTDAIVTLRARTNEPTQCNITGRGVTDSRFDNEQQFNFSSPDSYTQDHVATLAFDDIAEDTEQSFTYRVECKNLAQRTAIANKMIIVYFGANMEVAIVSPPEYVGTPSTTLSARPDRSASCSWKVPGGTDNVFESVTGGVHSSPLQNLKDGSHDYLVSCQSNDLRNRGIANAQFVVDTKAPVLRELNGPSLVCGPESYTMRIDTLDAAPAIEFSISNASGSGATFQASPSNAVLSVNPAGMPYGDYLLSARVVTRANVTSEPLTRTIQIADPASEVCRVPAHCRNLTKDADEEGIDCGGADCRECKQCGQVPCPSGQTCTCSNGDTCVEGFCVYIDTIVPSAPVITAPGFVCAGVANATFNATDTGGIRSYNYTLQDDVRVIQRSQTKSGSASILLPLGGANGSLHWTVFATDTAGNDGPPATLDIDNPREGEDEECGRPPFIQLRKPPLGYATSAPYALELWTRAAAQCRMGTRQAAYSILRPLASTDARTHTSEGLTFQDQQLFVSCNETATGKLHNKTIRVGVDATAPVITVTAVPNPLIDRADLASVNFTVQTSDPTFCTLSGSPLGGSIADRPNTFNTTHTKMLDLSAITDDARREIIYQVQCTNLANLSASAKYTLTVHLGANLSITVLSPPSYTAATPVVLSVRPNKQAECRFKKSGTQADNPFPTVEGNVHTTTLDNVTDGTSEYLITCLAIDGAQGSAVAKFLLDTQPPRVNLTGPTKLCKGQSPRTYTVDVATKDKAPTVTYALEGVAPRNITARTFTINQSNLTAGTYSLRATATTSAGVTSDAATLSLEVLAPDDPVCNPPVDHCANRVKDADEQGIDCGGSCAACAACTNTTRCSGARECLDGTCVCPAGKAFCGAQCIDITSDPKNCGACGLVCVGACVDSKCVPANPCANGLKDPGEEGVDCGGTCPGKCTNCTSTAQCGEDQTCNAKGQVCVCPTGQQLCGTKCVDVGSDEANCGACATACLEGQTCTSGTCCGKGQASCGGTCTDLLSSDTSCGACGKTCSDATSCEGGACTGCEEDEDCAGAETCVKDDPVAPVCIVPHCENEKKDANEQGIDCGGDCAPCVLCRADKDCATHEKCQDAVCIKTDSCTTVNDCDVTEECAAGKCVPTGRCATDTDCTGDKVCDASGVCVAPVACDDETPCPDGETCEAGFCVKAGGGPIIPPPGTGGTCSDLTQNNGEEGIDCGGPNCPPCGTGAVPLPDPEQPGSAKSHLLSILLIAFGVAIMGGSGYYLYEQDRTKKLTPAARTMPYSYPQQSRPAPAQPAAPALNPQLQQKYEQEQAARQAALAEAWRKHEAEKEAQRKALFQAFDKPGPQQPGQQASPQARPASPSTTAPQGTPAQQPAAPQAPSATNAPGAKPAAATPSAAKPAKADDEDVFMELDKLGKGGK